MVHLVQIVNDCGRRIELVEEPTLRCLIDISSVFDLALGCIRQRVSLSHRAHALAIGETLSYDEVYSGTSGWHLLQPIDIPGAPERVLVTGTGLTHLDSARTVSRCTCRQ
jgi:hypothetical protein